MSETKNEVALDSLVHNTRRIAYALEALAVGFDSTRPEARLINEMTKIIARDLVPRIRSDWSKTRFSVFHRDRFEIEGTQFEVAFETRVIR